MTIKDEDQLPVCNFCEKSYDPFDPHTCAGNQIWPRVTRRQHEDTPTTEDAFDLPADHFYEPVDTAAQEKTLRVLRDNNNGLPNPSAFPPMPGLTRQDVGEMLDAERQRVTGYETLEDVLHRAYLQAATGKGAARHGRGVQFDEQPTQAISRLLGTDAGLAFQAMKKINEGMRLEHDAKIKELLGAINYIASMIIYMEYHNGR